MPIDEYHGALAALIAGNPEPYKALFSHREGVTLGYPFGPVGCGWGDVAGVLEMATGVHRDGEIVGYENLARCVTPDLICIVELERFRAKVAGADESASVSLRVTSIFRSENGAGGWSIDAPIRSFLSARRNR